MTQLPIVYDPRTLPDLAEPGGDIRAGAIAGALFFILFLGWASFARLDAAAMAGGKLVVSGQRQTVQHRDGGIVSAIYVRDGQRVVAGQPLLRLAGAEAEAEERALTAQVISLLAQRNRLRAEQLGQSGVAEPVEFASLPPADRPLMEEAMRLQRTELAARRSVLLATRAALGQRAAQAGQQGAGYGSQLSSARTQLSILNDQINAMRPLAEKGFVSMTRMRELERARAEIQGAQGQFSASVAGARAAAGESQLQSLQSAQSYLERSAAELRDVEIRLGDLMPRFTAARDRAARNELRAPATGAVVGLSVFTPGAVVAPGQKLMDVVPEKAALRIEALLSPTDADDVRTGMPARVRLVGLGDRSIPDLEGSVTRMSADAFIDEKTGASYFTAEVTVPDSALSDVRRTQYRPVLRAGMPVQVVIPIRQRTALQYMLEPLVGAFWNSLGEH